MFSGTWFLPESSFFLSEVWIFENYTTNTSSALIPLQSMQPEKVNLLWHNVSEIMFVQVIRPYSNHYQLEKFQRNRIASGYIKNILRVGWILGNLGRKIKKAYFWYFKSNLNFLLRCGLKYFTIYKKTLKSKFKWNKYLTFLNMKYLIQYKINPSEIFLCGAILIFCVATQLNLGIWKFLAKMKFNHSLCPWHN